MRLFSSILTVFYLTFSIGVGVSSHYCMGVLKDVSFGMEAERCVCADSEMFGDCCEDVHQLFQIDDDQQGGQFKIFFSQVFDLKAALFPIYEILPKSEITAISEYPYPPPKSGHSRIFIQSLILYA